MANNITTTGGAGASTNAGGAAGAVTLQIDDAEAANRDITVNGVDPRSARIRNLEADSGRFITPLDVERSARVAYLGSVAAERLYGALPAVGRTLQIESVRFRVIGVNRSKGDQMVGVNGWDDWTVFIPWTTAQRWILKDDNVTKVAFAPLTREDSWQAIREVREIVALHHDFPHAN